MSKEILDRVVTYLLAVTAMVIAGTTLHREMRAGAEDPRSATAVQLEDSEWDAIAKASQESEREAEGLLLVVQFSDYQCPFCRRFHALLDSLEAEEHLGIVDGIVHFPLAQHPFARPAAEAAECARAQGGFASMSRQLFVSQDSLGLLTWGELAYRAGLADTASIGGCVASRRFAERVEAGVELGKRLRVNATPTVVAGGRRFQIPPSADQLRILARELQSR